MSQQRRLGDLVKLTSGKSPSSFRFAADGIPYFKVDQLGKSSKYLTNSDTPYFAKESPTVPARSVLIAKRGAAIALDRVRIIRQSSFMDTNVMALTPTDELDGEYLFYWLAKRGLWDIADVTSVPQINNKHINPLQITLPPLRGQRKVVNHLSDVDSLIDALERLISKKRAIKQGLMQELLSGKTRLPGFHSPWVTYSFGHLLSYEQPGPYLVGSAEYSQSGIPVLTAGKTFVLGYTRENDGIYAELPVIIFDDFTTATQYVDFPFKAKSSAMKILTAKPGVDIRWVFEKMQNVKFNAVDHKRRWITEYSKIEIPTPSLEEQRAIAEVIRDADDEIRTLQSRLESARNIKQGMMQELLTGRTRLPIEEVSS